MSQQSPLSPLSESEFKALVYDYAYDLLETQEVEQFESALSQHPEWQRYLDGANHAQAQLTQWQPDHHPKNLSQGVMDAIDKQVAPASDPVASGATVISFWPRAISIAAAIVVIGSLSVVTLMPDKSVSNPEVAVTQDTLRDEELAKAIADASRDVDSADLKQTALAKSKKEEKKDTSFPSAFSAPAPMAMKEEKQIPQPIREETLIVENLSADLEELEGALLKGQAPGLHSAKVPTVNVESRAAATTSTQIKDRALSDMNRQLAPAGAVAAAEGAQEAQEMGVGVAKSAPTDAHKRMHMKAVTRRAKAPSKVVMADAGDTNPFGVQQAIQSGHVTPRQQGFGARTAPLMQPPAPAQDDWTEPVHAPLAQHKDFGFNPFINVKRDNRSTFALEVDSASFSLAQDALAHGKQVNPNAIRSEEFINYIDYHYPAPTNGDFAIHLESGPMRFGNIRPNTQVLRVGLKAREVTARQPIVLTLVIDTSGSMRGHNMRLTQRALRTLINQLRPTDHVGIITYATQAYTALAPTPVSQKEVILGIVDQLQTSGSTYAEAGLKRGYDQLRQHLATHSTTKGFPRLILFSDGVANVGKTGPEAILKTIAAEREKGIFLTTIGVSRGQFNDALMEQLADKGNGSYHVLNSNERAEHLFNKKLMSLLVPIAQDAKAHVMFNPNAVKDHRLIGYENRKMAHTDFRNDHKDAGEIGAGHDITVLYEVELQPNPNGILAQVNLRYRQVASQTVLELPVDIDVAKRKATWEATSRATRLACVATALAQGLRQKQSLDRDTLQALIRELDTLTEGVEDAQDITDMKTMAKALLKQQPFQR